MTSAPTDRTRVRRLPQRGAYDAATIHPILDEAFVCHFGFVFDGSPCIIPTSYGRAGDTLYVHGSAASRALRAAQGAMDVTIVVTLIDGLVLARSAFHHSMNYRSVVVYGKARLVDDPAEKLEALRVITDHIVPNRWDAVRAPNDQEMKATTVLALSLDEASAKVRTGGPKDDDDDYELDIWAGVIPVRSVWGPVVPDELLRSGIEAPDHATAYRRPVSRVSDE